MSLGLLYVTTCPVCFKPMRGEEFTETGLRTYHGATPASAAVRAAHVGPWPHCADNVPYRAGCRNQPVPPRCCAQVPTLGPAVLPLSTDNSRVTHAHPHA
ncbi:hypothetical protein FJV41_19830 [Myxococcus llanfairpwllgwyngyllgogerychwyrndrobwllllantysiliogogogochensis]|uniref:Uncharacterized protein n=1 Tax=Myxococcus llanfairpwllgwyngyllgogerychwyrndrobwllllantysiliogogogochensis TaxID=2590453 RepID=A0A540WYY9_9BACT|nr:hypothetical protein [Myxococcus llanfairpwllgwyngyllgogerychwyrndrobwllllantysiliogogogochensis]TQF14221.1 hypothetical protein FJV41_19830 [Myxococcus llanfairpwllgwyngyllgogerychwyrndrobwllllantysiliogogogochensis]